MKVVITDTASESLWPIYERHLEYSEDYAVNFQREIDAYMLKKFSAHPELGPVVHEPRGIRRLVYKKWYNIYYTIRPEVVFILFIFHGRLEINQLIRDHGLNFDDLPLTSDEKQ